MYFAITSAKLTGTPGEVGWAQVHDFRPDDKGKLSSRGHLFAVIATKKRKEGLETVEAGRELLSRLHEEYFGNTEGGAFHRLKEAVEKVISEFSASWGDVEIAAATVLDEVVYTAAGGGARVSIYRSALANILVSDKDKVVAASGYPQKKDILICATSKLFETFSGGRLRAALEEKNPNEAVESLAPTVHSASDTSNLGAVFIKFEEGGAFSKRVFADKKKDEPVGKVKIPGKGHFIKRLEGFILRLKKSLPARRIYVRKDEEDLEARQGRKVAASVGAILLLILVASIGFGIRQRRQKETRARYETRLVQAQHDFEEGVSLYSLNPSRARELFEKSRNLVGELQREGVEDPELEKLKEDIELNQGLILGEYRQDAELFIDLSLLSEGFSGERLSAAGEAVFILDAEGRKVARVIIDTKKAEVVAGPDLIKEVEDIAVYSDRIFIINSQGVFEIDEESVQVLERDWEGQVLVQAYAANLYILDKGESLVWRYAGAGDSFASKKAWLAPGIEVDFSGVIGLSIDGSIWFLFDSGKILKLTSGSPESLSVSGVKPQLTGPAAIYTNEELNFVYILEPDAKRVVVIDKSGEYKAQYISEEISRAQDLAVFEDQGKIIFLTGPQLLSIELKHPLD